MSVIFSAIWTFVFAFFAKLWDFILKVVSTPLGAALVAMIVLYPIVSISTKHRVNAAWQTKWDKAAVEADNRRLERDAQIKRDMAVEVDKRQADLSAREAALKKKVDDYVPTPADARCLTDDRDARWLRDLGRSRPDRSR